MSLLGAVLGALAAGGGAALGWRRLRRRVPYVRSLTRPKPYRISIEHALEVIGSDAYARRGWPFLKEVSGYYDEPIFTSLLDGDDATTVLRETPNQTVNRLIRKNLIIIEDENGVDVSHWPIEFWRIDDINTRRAAYQAYQDAKL